MTRKIDYLDNDGRWKMITIDKVTYDGKLTGQFFNPPDEKRQVMFFFPEMIYRVAKLGSKTLQVGDMINVLNKRTNCWAIRKIESVTGDCIVINNTDKDDGWHSLGYGNKEYLYFDRDCDIIENCISPGTSLVLYQSKEDLIYEERKRNYAQKFTMYQQIDAPKFENKPNTPIEFKFKPKFSYHLDEMVNTFTDMVMREYYRKYTKREYFQHEPVRYHADREANLCQEIALPEKRYYILKFDP